jgi:hypothetical protein
MIGKMFIIGGLISFGLFLYYFVGVKWILPLGIILVIAYVAIKIIGKVLKRDRGSRSEGSDGVPYFDRLFTD